MKNIENNKNLIIIVIILLIVIVGVFLWISSGNNTNNIDNKVINKNNVVEKISDVVVKKELIENKKDDYKKSETYKKCLENGLDSKECFYREVKRMVSKEDNGELCNYLEDEKQRDICKNNYYMKKAIKNTDLKYCDYLKNKDDCIFMVYKNKAEKENNKEVCNSLTGIRKQLDCKSSIVEREAIELKDESKCDGLNNEEYSDFVDFCKDNVKSFIEEEKLLK